MKEEKSTLLSEKLIEQRIKENIGTKGLKINRVFTTKGKDRYATIEFDKRTSKIINPDGSVVFEMKDVEVPVTWSQMATDILAQKYFRKKGVPLKNSKGEIRKDKNGEPITGSETSAKQVTDRLAIAWRSWGEEYGYFNSKEDADAFEDELAYMLINQMCAPNSPQWFNTGLKIAYGITGKPQGHYYVDPISNEVKLSEDAYTRQQVHACYIQSLADDLVNDGGIFSLLTREARTFKYGSGTGTNFSNLRGVGEPLSGGGKSSGLMSFLKIFDAAAGSIKSGGTTRRAAKMVCLNVDHPEIEEFIQWKSKEEQKVAALVAGSHILFDHLKKIMKSAETNGLDPKVNKELKGLIKKAKDSSIPLQAIKSVLMLVENGVKADDYTIQKFDTDFRSDAYTTVSGQNSNNSIRITNDFLDAVEKDADWNLVNRTDGSVYKTVKAKKLWESIVMSAWQSADPGVQFDTTVNEWHTCPKDGRINASNPCSEYMFLDDTGCNLASLNLTKFYDEKTKQFDVESFRHAVRLWTMVLEISILMSHLVDREMAIKTFKYRTLGLGYANLGSLLMKQGIPYDSEKGFALTSAITAIMGGESYATSAEMAKVLGAFERYEYNKEDMLRVIRNHKRATYLEPSDDYEDLTVKPMPLNESLVDTNLVQAAQESWDMALELGKKYGYRNAQTTLIAPTGTVALVMDCDTTGIEPDFALVKFKKLVGGGYFKIVNNSVRPALMTLGYPDSQIDAIEKYIVGHKTLVDAPFINPASLAQKGFTQKELSVIEANLENAFDLRSVFSVWNLGEDFCKEVLKISTEKLNDPSLNILRELGFSDNQIEETEEYVCGTMTIEGAPYLKLEHYAVFDCANKCGKKGERYISTNGHLKQMAAAQAFLSGAISKTVNLPEEASLKDIENAYLDGWKLMLKANALYRDASKLSQPLTTSRLGSTYAALFSLDEEDVDEVNVRPETVQQAIKQEFAAPKRRRLPEERHSITHKFMVGGHEGFITVGLFEDGSPGEIFITMSKAGSTLSGIMDAFAISLSISLQYGVPLEVLIRNFADVRFEPSGMTGNKEIPMAKSIIDYISRWMAIKFLEPETAKIYHNEELVEKSYREGSNYRILIPVINGHGHTELKPTKYIRMKEESFETLTMGEYISSEVSHVEPIQMKLETPVEPFHDHIEQTTISKFTITSKTEVAKSKGYTGEVCGSCGSMNIRKNGSCSVCESCGATTGCS